MPGFDYLSLTKRQAKALSQRKSIPLHAAYEVVALDGGFKHYHELKKIADTNPNDTRLMRSALQTDDLSDVVSDEWQVYDHKLGEFVKDGYKLQVTASEYDKRSGVLTTHADVLWPYWGSDKLYLHIVIRLFRHAERWSLYHTDPVEIVEDKRPTIKDISTDPFSVHHLFYDGVDPSNRTEVGKFNQTLLRLAEVLARDDCLRLRILECGVLDIEADYGWDVYVNEVRREFGKDNTREHAMDVGALTLAPVQI